MTEIENIHYCLLVITKEIKRICEKNNIKYFMLAGTTLGAVRHQGFIPWDDDMDFGMLREDYDRFMKLCETELDTSHFFLQNNETDPGYAKFYSRILLKDTFLDYLYIQNTSSQRGLFVDIFPFDNIPANKFLQKKQSLITSFARRLYKQKLHYIEDQKTLGCKIELLFTPFFSKKQLLKMYNNQMAKYSKKETGLINSPNAGYGYFKEILQKKWTNEIKMYKFEDIELPAFAMYDEYLTHLYGDYMTIPPKDKQVTHQINKIDFGPYKL